MGSDWTTFRRKRNNNGVRLQDILKIRPGSENAPNIGAKHSKGLDPHCQLPPICTSIVSNKKK